MSSSPPSMFFCYPSYPSTLRETQQEGARKIGILGSVQAQTWESLRISGKVIIDEITRAIRSADLVSLDLTGINHNLMFELGYSIGAEKRVWALLDDSDEEAKRKWDRLRFLTTLGYDSYTNSDDIRAAFLRTSPQLAEQSLFEQSIGPSLRPGIKSSIFYLQSNHPTEASRVLSRRIAAQVRRSGRIVTEDPSESAVYPLTWYAQQIYSARACVVHLAADRRTGAHLHNAKAAFVAGLAYGMSKEVLILAEDDYLAPIDYRDLVFVYPTAKRLGEHIDGWLNAHDLSADRQEVLPAQTGTLLQLKTELRSIRFGEPVAENEVGELSEYFIETGSYRQVLLRNTTVFVGRKGAGKSANFLQAAQALSEDARNVVCVIQPTNYELEGLVRLLSRFSLRDEKQFAIETLWQYLLYSEIARAAAAQFREKPVGPAPGTPQWRLLEFVDDPQNGLQHEFAVRLERLVEPVAMEASESTIEESRQRITATLHAGVLPKLRRILGDALTDRERVCVLVDNLDKAWDRASDIEQLSFLLLGLLNAVQRVQTSFQRRDAWRQPVAVTLAVFLRSDIYEKVSRVASEPDKIPISRLVWTDRNLLLRVIEERYRAGGHENSDPEELWVKYFAPRMDGKNVRDYLLWRVLPRPRDLVQFCSAALDAAMNANHVRIEEDDLRSAAVLYSQFAFEALLVENGLTIEQLESVLIEFAGGDPILTSDWIDDAINRAGMPEDRKDEIITRLRQLSFLGLETGADVFSYIEDTRDAAKFNALARALGDRRGAPARYEIHPAFRPYLDISDAP